MVLHLMQVCMVVIFKFLSGFTTVQVIDEPELTEYDLPLNGTTAFIIISQSGETADLYDVLKLQKNKIY